MPGNGHRVSAPTGTKRHHPMRAPEARACALLPRHGGRRFVSQFLLSPFLINNIYWLTPLVTLRRARPVAAIGCLHHLLVPKDNPVRAPEARTCAAFPCRETYHARHAPVAAIGCLHLLVPKDNICAPRKPVHAQCFLSYIRHARPVATPVCLHITCGKRLHEVQPRMPVHTGYLLLCTPGSYPRLSPHYLWKKTARGAAPDARTHRIFAAMHAR
ncbi:hypothetical protein Bbelb_370070 [Branchiostoma belcheri]|nr:hypothetical protein Bbelb_370070 [Branchiostoma belcheri]